MIAIDGVDAIDVLELKRHQIGGLGELLAFFDGGHQRAHIAHAGGGVGAFDNARVGDGAGKQRGLVAVAVETDTGTRDGDVSAACVQGTITHVVVVLFARHHLFDILAPGIDIIGMNVLRPYLAHLIDGSGR